jgi:ferredoxin
MFVPKVTFVNEKRTVEVERGASLRYAALENDVPLYCLWFGISKIANCHGNGLCWTDRVRISPAGAVTPKTLLETAMNQFGTMPKNRDPQTRLACQVQVLDDCEVVTRCRTRR